MSTLEKVIPNPNFVLFGPNKELFRIVDDQIIFPTLPPAVTDLSYYESIFGKNHKNIKFSEKDGRKLYSRNSKGAEG